VQPGFSTTREGDNIYEKGFACVIGSLEEEGNMFFLKISGIPLNATSY
jgi:hypothetical protein